MIKLPELILNPSDVYQFNIIDDIPNFVTQKRIVAKIIKEPDIISDNCAGKIAVIASADPGYDFLFSRGIVGLVTMFGGANSHMVIRCSELGLPAAIGVGEKTFNLICNADTVEIDSLNKTIRVIS
jgi:phosphoenolpyruvate-protein kinase (PTS system EI component)